MQGVQAVRWLARNRSSTSGWRLASGSCRETERYKLGLQIEGMARGLTTIAGMDISSIGGTDAAVPGRLRSLSSRLGLIPSLPLFLGSF